MENGYVRTAEQLTQQVVRLNFIWGESNAQKINSNDFLVVSNLEAYKRMLTKSPFV